MAGPNEYLTVTEDSVGEIIEKKSRFIALLHHVESEEEALEFINNVKKEHWDARHNCFAYVIGTGLPAERANDDSEPSRTAGLPILESIKAAELTNVCIVVTRYFGGILLGTGPLAKAYRDASKAAVDNASVVRMRCLKNVVITADYDSYGKLRYEADRLSLKVIDAQFSDKVLVRMALDESETGHMTAFMNELSRGNCNVTEDGEIWVRELTTLSSSDKL
ncbi:MAG: YigZ family protein [Lachnospiraceae bacterium]|nr:YigZ family protein [Lachnospiraceae bacterium]